MLEGYSRKRTAVKKGTNPIKIKNLQKKDLIPWLLVVLLTLLECALKQKKPALKELASTNLYPC